MIRLPPRSTRTDTLVPYTTLFRSYMQVLGSVARALDFPLTTPWNKLPESAREAVLYGTKGEAIALRFEDGRKSYEVVKPFEGVIRNLERRKIGRASCRERVCQYV